MRYYDTGIIIKLYTEEPESEVVRSFVLDDGEPILINDFHLSEMTAAITLNKYRGECSTLQVERLLSSIDEDRNKGVLTFKGVDWPEAWRMCRSLAMEYAPSSGCRTLDTLHVACAVLLKADNFVSSDKRQLQLASLTGFKVINPTSF